MEDLTFIWKRPSTIEHPKVWHTFKARDLDSDEFVEYRIQDLPLDRIDYAFEHMAANYNQDEPIAQALGNTFWAFLSQYEYNESIKFLKGGGKQLNHLEDYRTAWRPMVEQKVPLVCFKEGCDEIVGINMLFVWTKMIISWQKSMHV